MSYHNKVSSENNTNKLFAKKTTNIYEKDDFISEERPFNLHMVY
jgi:hypothetical protein